MAWKIDTICVFAGEGGRLRAKQTKQKNAKHHLDIYVGNLAYATTDDGLKAAFAQ